MMEASAYFSNTLDLPPVSQIGLVVRDLKRTEEYYTKIIGLGPFVRPDISFDQIYYRGRLANSKWLMSFCSLGSVEMELIQPISGPTIYEDFLLAVGEGLHHIGFDVDDMEAKLSVCEKLGIKVIQSGLGPSSWFAYLDTAETGGVTYELIQRKQRRA